MRPISEAAIRSSFVNCTAGEVKRLAMPRDLDELRWDDLDFLGWQDPAAPQRAYLVAESAAGHIGVSLRVAQQTGRVRRSMCSLCLTTHTGDGVSLMTARKAGREGRQGNSVGAYICTDLDCSLYVRGKKNAGRRIDETITIDEKIDRTVAALMAFLRRIAE
ncbi:FBP domain-containing protein [Actinoplanes sp. NPDC051859]|uniref:FBP domain-containing protein n=1 Tax=Actinoplanes sp. NPDC051859 TaxID=3363909 RepID=UPI00379D3822